ncbi:MAG: ferritin-like domain-containing protein [Sedimentisphaerales bacterium]|nr:ferritin-like domain-containing protein [Sedimentisphaerales bacterium]
MGTKGKAIVQLDVDELIRLLNKAFADEWLAYYQYWTGAQVVKGPMRGAVTAELNEHAQDELRHAGMLTERIMQLGGEFILDPADWKKLSNCSYDAPENPFVKNILDQNIKGEQCAIEVYHKLVELTRDKDIVTYNMVVEILEDEVEHEEDLQALLEDLEIAKKQK